MLGQKLRWLANAIEQDDQATARRLIAELRSVNSVIYNDINRLGIIYDSTARAWIFEARPVPSM